MPYDRSQQRRIDAGLCKDCGTKREPNGTTIYCRKCADRIAKRATKRTSALRKNYSKAGLCGQCGSKSIVGTKFKICDKCRTVARKSHLKHSVEKREEFEKQGLCVRCGRKRIGDSRYCKKHWLECLRKHDFKMAEWNKIYKLLEQQEFRCFYTKVLLIPGANACIDHLIPRSKSQKHINDLTNIVWCDKRINLMKGNFTYDEFIKTCKAISALEDDVNLLSNLGISCRPRIGNPKSFSFGNSQPGCPCVPACRRKLI